MANKETTIGEVMEILSSIKNTMVTKEALNAMKESMVTKDDLKRELAREISGLRAELQYDLALRPTRDEMKEELQKVKMEIMDHMDGFARQYQTHNEETAMLRVTLDRHEDRIVIVEQKLGLASV